MIVFLKYLSWKYLLALFLLVLLCPDLQAQDKIAVNIRLKDIMNDQTLAKMAHSNFFSFNDYAIINKKNYLEFYPKKGSGVPIIFGLDGKMENLNYIFCSDWREVLKQRDLLSLLTDAQIDAIKKAVERENASVNHQVFAYLEDESLYFDLDDLPVKKSKKFKMKKILLPKDKASFKNVGGSGICLSYRLSISHPDRPVKDHAILFLQDKNNLGQTKVSHMAVFISENLSSDKYESNKDREFLLATDPSEENRIITEIQEILLAADEPDITIFGTENSKLVFLIAKAIVQSLSQGFNPKSVKINVNNQSDFGIGITLNSGNIVLLDDIPDQVIEMIYKSMRL